MKAASVGSRRQLPLRGKPYGSPNFNINPFIKEETNHDGVV